MLLVELDVMEYAVVLKESSIAEESDDDILEEEDYYEPDYDECGFNPYMGCYDFDC